MTTSAADLTTIWMVVFVAFLLAAYLWARWRLGDWSDRRDPAMLVWIVVLGAIVILLVNAAESLFVVVLPLILVAAGVYGVARRWQRRDQPAWLVACLALVAGIGWFVVGAVRQLL